MARTESAPPAGAGRVWIWIVAAGVLLMILGAFAIAAPFVASVAINAWIGIAFLLAGIGRLVHVMQGEGWKRSAGHLLTGLVYIGGGLLVIFNPLAGLLAFSLLIVAMLVVSGISQLVEGLRRRPEQGWGWAVAAGVVALVAAIVIYMSFPGGALWLLGLMAGLAFVMEGSALLSLGLAIRRARP